MSVTKPPRPQPPGSKIGYPLTGKPPDRSQATLSQQPQAQPGRVEGRIAIDTYFTKSGGTEIIYNGDRQWARVTLTLQTAGPVDVGQYENLTPVGSGKGQDLTTNVPVTFNIAKGSRLYIAATGVNRVKRVIEPVPWLEQITALVMRVAGIK